MSIHPTLRSTEKDKKQRSVLKRTERLKMMKDKNQWKEGDGVFGLPKIKTLRIKIKKEKAEKAQVAPAEGAATTAIPVETKAPAPAKKGSAPGKGQEKK